MHFLAGIYKIVLDALFPLSKSEEEILALRPEEAFTELPPAPPYTSSVVPLPNTRSIFAYKDERVSKLIWSIKYKRSGHSIQIGGYALYQSLKKLAAGPSMDKKVAKILVSPIPITARRRRERGFNQCELLLDEIKRLDAEKRFIYEKNLLERVAHSSRQTLKGRDERLESSKGIFAVDDELVKQLTLSSAASDYLIVVIDDVITTGSTMKEALDVLKAAGFPNVTAISLAH